MELEQSDSKGHGEAMDFSSLVKRRTESSFKSQMRKILLITLCVLIHPLLCAQWSIQEAICGRYLDKGSKFMSGHVSLSICGGGEGGREKAKMVK